MALVAKMTEDETMVRADYEGHYHMRSDNSFGMINHTDEKLPIGFTVKINKKAKTRMRQHPYMKNGEIEWKEKSETYYTGCYHYGDDSGYWYGEGGLWFDAERELIDTDGDVSLREGHVIEQMIRFCGWNTASFFRPNFTNNVVDSEEDSIEWGQEEWKQ